MGEVTGDLIRKWEEDIVYISDRDAAKEKAFRRKDIYSFYFMLATESRKRKSNEKLTESFGAGTGTRHTNHF